MVKLGDFLKDENDVHLFSTWSKWARAYNKVTADKFVLRTYYLNQRRSGNCPFQSS